MEFGESTNWFSWQTYYIMYDVINDLFSNFDIKYTQVYVVDSLTLF